MLICLSLAEEEGIEPPLTVLETAALPLYYSSILQKYLQPPKMIIAYSPLFMQALKINSLPFYYFIILPFYTLLSSTKFYRIISTIINIYHIRSTNKGILL